MKNKKLPFIIVIAVASVAILTGGYFTAQQTPVSNGPEMVTEYYLNYTIELGVVSNHTEAYLKDGETHQINLEVNASRLTSFHVSLTWTDDENGHRAKADTFGLEIIPPPSMSYLSIGPEGMNISSNDTGTINITYLINPVPPSLDLNFTNSTAREAALPPNNSSGVWSVIVTMINADGRHDLGNAYTLDIMGTGLGYTMSERTHPIVDATDTGT